MSKPYVILTGGDGGFGNLGDEWLFDAVRKRYRSPAENHRVVVLRPILPLIRFDDFEYTFDSPEGLSRSGLSLSDVDYVHFYGGGYLNNYWMQDKLWLYDYLVGKGYPKHRIFFTGQGLGPLDAEKLARVTKVAKECLWFGSRDRILEKDVHSHFMFDETVSLAKDVCERPRGKKLLVNIRIANHVGADEKRIAALLKSLAEIASEKDLELTFFSMIRGKEFSERKEMQRILGQNGLETEVLERPRKYTGLMRMYKEAAMVVTTSYHATLASLYSAVPAVAVYENDYYRLKYFGLRDALPTPTLGLLNLREDNQRSIILRTLDATDPLLNDKLRSLSSVNAAAYQEIEKRLNAQR